MTVTFSDLHKESGLKALNDFLSGKSSISGDQLTKDDIKVYAAVLGEPSADLYPNASKWIGGAAAAESAAPAEVAAADDDDDLDLFGDETEEERKAAEQREAAKATTKKKERHGKSSVLLDVKPWDDETDMKKLEEAVRSVELPGLFWGASKLVAVGYGIKKLQIMLTIVDDLVSVDTMIEEILTVEPINEYVQSCDIAAFNKI
ncbi:hypothetical protein ACS0TY_017349 [Phlomoides rotata]